MSVLVPLVSALLACTAVDGDTLRCGAERVRLIGIDAPELPGHCDPRRRCVSGNARASKAALPRLVGGRWVRLDRRGQDRYGRTLAFAFVGNRNLSCVQLRGGFADYVPRWDIGGVAGRC
jgi:Micrococcal nuclease (thermonuclease) homologs